MKAVSGIALFALLFLACGPSPEADPKPTSIQPKAPKMQADTTKPFEDLNQISRSQAIEKYGTPYQREDFILDDMQGEFRITLNRHFSREERQSETVRISELTWQMDGDSLITVWYHELDEQTIPKEVFIWEKGSEF